MKEIRIKVEGMTCEHCAARVNKFLKEVKGVKEINTVLKENISYVTADDEISMENMQNAIREAGYTPGKLESIEKK